MRIMGNNFGSKAALQYQVYNKIYKVSSHIHQYAELIFMLEGEMRITVDDKEEYIKALVTTREEDNLDIFRTFMYSMMQKNLTLEIENYISSVGEVHEDGVEYQKSKPKKIKSRDKIVALLTDNNKLSAVALAERIGISTKAVEKHLSNLKADGIIKRIGPDKGGHWEVVE